MLQEYIESLQKIKDKYGDLPLIYSADDEGNRFSDLFYQPMVCKFDGEEMVETAKIEEYNAVCIN
jgi:hypothetical protein